MTKAERIAVYFETLAAAPAASTAVEAFDLAVSTFVANEDMLCVDEADRMQPPSGEYYFEVEGRADLDLYRQRAHDTFIGSNGAILVRIRKTGEIKFSKAGADGKEINL